MSKGIINSNMTGQKEEKRTEAMVCVYVISLTITKRYGRYDSFIQTVTPSTKIIFGAPFGNTTNRYRVMIDRY
jgi:hypothetical protein